MSDEDRLRARLREQVARVPAVADLDDVASRIHRREQGRSRSLAVIGVVALLVGSTAGFAVGRTGRRPVREVVAAGAPSSSTVRPGSVAQGIENGPGQNPTVSKRLFVRTTADGVTIRTYDLALAMINPSSGASVPAYLSVEAEMSTDAAVTMTMMGSSSPSTLPIGAMSPGTFGENEHAPTQWLIVQVRSDVARVRASFAGGGSDEMQPQHEVAVLAHLGDGLPVSVDALDGNGHVLDTETVPAPECGGSGCPPATVPASTATTEGNGLPAPGRQPSDVPAARQAVTRAFEGAFDGAASDATRVGVVQGGSALVSVFEQLRHGQFAASVQSAKTVVEGVVFLSPTSATAKFHSHLSSGTDSGPYLGQAILTPVGWQVTRASYCQLAAAAGAQCP